MHDSVFWKMQVLQSDIAFWTQWYMFFGLHWNVKTVVKTIVTLEKYTYYWFHGKVLQEEGKYEHKTVEWCQNCLNKLNW